MNWKIMLASVVFIGGCSMPADPEWSSAPETHVCTIDQMERVKSETDWCALHSDYTKRYCYGSAIMRICARRDLGGNAIHD